MRSYSFWPLAWVSLLTACVPQQRSASPPSEQEQRTAPPVYEVSAISYGVLPSFPVAGLVAGADTARRMDIQMMVWLVRGAGDRIVLIDSGFHRERMVRDWKPRDFVRPSDALARAGLDAAQITDLVITHLHWDHAGGVDLFPNARVWIQKEEYDHYRDPAVRATRTGVDAEDLAVLERLEAEGRLMLIPGDAQQILPGITVYTGGRHTYASQYVGVNTAAGTVVVASDNLYLYENLEKRLPIAQTLDPASNLRAQERMLRIASSPRLVVPGHDPAVFVRFPTPGGGVATIR
jgi:glyoxylase-like metal-dependent hydrolase (beta-lactamase superfamily II)